MTKIEAFPVKPTFARFVAAGKLDTSALDPTLAGRLIAGASGINTCATLLRWTKEREPDAYFMGLRIKMERIWAQYLKWADAQPGVTTNSHDTFAARAGRAV
jgi:hypothetical protein